MKCTISNFTKNWLLTCLLLPSILSSILIIYSPRYPHLLVLFWRESILSRCLLRCPFEMMRARSCSGTRTAVSNGVSQLCLSLASQGPGRASGMACLTVIFVVCQFTKHLSSFLIMSTQEKTWNSLIPFLNICVLFNRGIVWKHFNSVYEPHLIIFYMPAIILMGR